MTTLTPSNPAETPSQALARQIVERLVADRLLRAEDAHTMRSKLADGTLSAEDWRLSIELGGEQGDAQ